MQKIEKTDTRYKTCNVCREKAKRLRDRKQAEQTHVHQEMEQIERRCCSGCQIMQKVEKFDEGYKTCNVCREKKELYRENNPDKGKECNQNRMNKVRDEIVTRTVCNYDIKKCKLKQHEQSQTHQYNMKKFDPDFEKDVPKPDKIRVMNGKEMYECNTCRSTMLPCVWSKHFNQAMHIKCEERRKASEQQ